MSRYLFKLPVFVYMTSFLLAGGDLVCAADEISFRAVCFDPRDIETPTLFIAKNGAAKPMELNKSKLSVPQTAAVRDGKFVDFLTSNDPKSGEPPVTLTLPEAPLDHLLVIFIPGEKGYRAMPVKIPDGDFKGGSTLIINLSTAEIATKLGDAKPLLVPRTGVKVLPLPSGHKEAMIPVQISSRATEADPWRIEQSTRWLADKGYRSYIFFYQDPASKRLQLSSIEEPFKK